MSFQNIDQIEEALMSGSLSARELHTIWEQRQPVPERDARKKSGSAGTGTVTGATHRQIDWLRGDLALARRFTKRALEKEEYLLVCDAAREALRLESEANEQGQSELVGVRMDYACALTQLGLTRDARRVLEPCLGEGFPLELGRGRRTDILIQLGNILREESHHASTKAERLNIARAALEFYERALTLDPQRLEALVLTAAASLIVGREPGPVHERACQILELAAKREDTEGPRFQTTVARAAAHTILGQVEEARLAYSKLQSIKGITTAQLAEARFRARFLAEALGREQDLFKDAFPPLQLIVFAGHCPDRPDCLMRFPNESIEAVRATLRAKLDEMQARVGLVSAAAGGDLLFIEALRARGGVYHVVLPWSQEEFRRTSIRPFEPPPGQPPIWEPLFDEALRGAATVRELGQVYEPSSDAAWEYTMEVTAGIALHTARAARLDVQPLVLWDGLPGRGAGGTESFYEFWRRQLRHEPAIVLLQIPSVQKNPGASVHSGARSERSILHQQVKSMLFADIVGYSKLNEHVIPEFVEAFLGRVSQLAASSKYAPRSVNTWGDAVYAVFDFASDAGAFALELTQMIEEGKADWLQKGLYWEEYTGEKQEPVKRPLNVRIGLHTGPVVMHYDPVVRRLGYTGAHVNRAARIEPVAKPGEVFASEEFAAMAEVGTEILRRRGSAATSAGFICEYAGSMQLAKNYPGRYRIYRLVPKRTFVIEELAKAAHEDYCEQARKRGESPETNAALRPWSELPEDLREANRAQVADIPNKLRVLGYELAPGHGIAPSQIPMSDQQVEQLAIREHDRWMAERQRNGWRYGPVRDNARKFHPLLVPWDQLSESEKEKDRDTVRNLPRHIERTGFRVRPIG